MNFASSYAEHIWPTNGSCPLLPMSVNAFIVSQLVWSSYFVSSHRNTHTWLPLCQIVAHYGLSAPCGTMMGTGPAWEWLERAIQNKRDVPIHQQACQELITHTNVWFKHSSLLCRRCSPAFVWTCGCVIIIFKSENMSCPSKKKINTIFSHYWHQQVSQWSSSIWRWHGIRLKQTLIDLFW